MTVRRRFVWRSRNVELKEKSRKKREKQMNIKREKAKRNIFLILQIVLIVLTFIGAGYVLLNHGESNAGYAVVPMLFALIFGMLFRNSQKAIKENSVETPSGK